MIRREFLNSLAAGFTVAAAGCEGHAETQKPAVDRGRLAITSPKSGERVTGDPIGLSGTGAVPGAQLIVTVTTNKDWLQNGGAKIFSDGRWVYSNCYISGQGQFNRHLIAVTMMKDGQVLDSAMVDGIVRMD